MTELNHSKLIEPFRVSVIIRRPSQLRPIKLLSWIPPVPPSAGGPARRALIGVVVVVGVVAGVHKKVVPNFRYD